VAQLKLNADWVVLSARNTAAADKRGVEALSGPARAFLLCGRAGASNIALVGRFGGRHVTHHLDIRLHDGRSEARPRGGPAQCDADLT
jgi:hypothetical protein